MQYAQCKCGAMKHWGSGMDPAPCRPCSKCGTVPGSGPNEHPEPVPHDFQVHDVETDDGPKPLSRCRWCTRTKADIARENALAEKIDDAGA